MAKVSDPQFYVFLSYTTVFAGRDRSMSLYIGHRKEMTAHADAAFPFDSFAAATAAVAEFAADPNVTMQGATISQHAYPPPPRTVHPPESKP